MSRKTIYQATAPSNIALIKYWGKRDSALQWPANDSLSMTLDQCHTQTNATFLDGPDHAFAFTDCATSPEAQSKVIKHLHNIGEQLKFSTPLAITSRNTFPSDCGIASSASGMAALTIAALAAWTNARTLDELAQKGYTLERIAHLARQGSGSAGRSLFGGYVGWLVGSSPEDQRLVPVHSATHWPLADLICVVSDQKKVKSSREAHADAWTSPLFLPRLAGLPERTRQVYAAIERKDLRMLGPLIEQEALEMHAVMMSSGQPVNYIQEETSRVLCWLREQRERHELPAYFTLDAGPNVHVLCEQKDAARVREQIQQAFSNIKIIVDGTGQGPTLSHSEVAL